MFSPTHPTQFTSARLLLIQIELSNLVSVRNLYLYGLQKFEEKTTTCWWEKPIRPNTCWYISFPGLLVRHISLILIELGPSLLSCPMLASAISSTPPLSLSLSVLILAWMRVQTFNFLPFLCASSRVKKKASEVKSSLRRQGKSGEEDEGKQGEMIGAWQ